jgi:hypothetical protein
LERSCGLGSDRELKWVLKESCKIIEKGLIAEYYVNEGKKMQINKSWSSWPQSLKTQVRAAKQSMITTKLKQTNTMLMQSMLQ